MRFDVFIEFDISIVYNQENKNSQIANPSCFFFCRLIKKFEEMLIEILLRKLSFGFRLNSSGIKLVGDWV